MIGRGGGAGAGFGRKPKGFLVDSPGCGRSFSSTSRSISASGLLPAAALTEAAAVVADAAGWFAVGLIDHTATASRTMATAPSPSSRRRLDSIDTRAVIRGQREIERQPRAR